MATKLINELQSLVSKLQAERRTHVDAIAAIDGAFQALGISGKAKGGGRSPEPAKNASVAKKKIKRRKFRRTASELILATIQKAGSKGATGARITKAWKAAGRPGDAYNALGTLLKAKKVKRQKIKGGRGSSYTVA